MPYPIMYLHDNWPTRNLPGIGPVSGCLVTSRTVDHAGTVSMDEKVGFSPTPRDDIRSADDPYHPGDDVVMRLHVSA